MEYLFSYGTLQDESIQMEVFGRRVPFDNDELPGYIISSNKAYGRYPLLEKRSDNNGGVSGICLHVTEDDLLEADLYEGEEYQRIKTLLKSGRKAWVYVGKQP